MKNLLLILLLISTTYVYGDTVDPLKQPLSNLNCDYPTERVDKSPIDWETEGGVIKWYYGFSSGVYEFGPVETTACQWVVDNNLFAGKTLYVTATATDSLGNESGSSFDEWVHEVLPIVLPPKPPTRMPTTPAIADQVATPLP